MPPGVSTLTSSSRWRVINLRASVQSRYYDVMAAIRNLEVAQQSLDLAQKLLDENRIKVRVGTLAPLDVVEAESEAAAREEDVIRAEGLLVCVRGPEDVDPDEVGEVVGALRHASGGGPVAPGYVVDGGPPRVLLLQAGGRAVPTAG